MNPKLTKKEWNNIIEHYAYRKSAKCMKLDDFCLLIGGNYTWNPCILKSQADWIYQNFVKNSYKLKEGVSKCGVVDTFHFKKEISGHVEYLIHTFKTKYNHLNRDKVAVNCGIKIDFPRDVSYVRIFSFPCK